MQFIVQGYPAYAYTGGRTFDSALPAIVFIHGAAFDHSVWQWQSRYFAHHGYSVLAVDLPGHARSPGMPRATIEEYAEWVAALLDAAALPQAALVGHSMGALVALETAIRHSPRVGLEMEAVWGHARLAQLASSPVPGASLLGASRRLNARSKPGALHAALNACNNYSADPRKVAALRMPVLVVSGRRDQMAQFKAGKALSESIPGARFAALDAGHSMMSEAPRELLGELRGFLG